MKSKREGNPGERLHKVLAHAGIASRRRCEDLIREGRVRVNGRIVREMGVCVDLARDEVQVDGERVRAAEHVYLVLYKPANYLCTTSDQWGRKTILDLVPKLRGARLFTVGRLDLDAEGLVIVTNDGDFAHDVLHPRRRLPRTYYVKVQGSLGLDLVQRAREGVWLSDGRTPPMDVYVMRSGREVSTAKCTVVERHHHLLRRIWARLGTPVLRLVLVRIGNVGTEGLKKGTFRALTPEEVADLRAGEPGRVGVAPVRRQPRRAPEEPRGPVAWGEPAAESERSRRGDREPKRDRTRPREKRGGVREGRDGTRPRESRGGFREGRERGRPQESRDGGPPAQRRRGIPGSRPSSSSGPSFRKRGR